MAIRGYDVELDTTAVVIWEYTGTADAMQTVLVQNESGGAVTIGGPDVAVGSLGIVLADGETLPVPGYYGDKLYGIAGSTLTVQVLVNRV